MYIQFSVPFGSGSLASIPLSPIRNGGGKPHPCINGAKFSGDKMLLPKEIGESVIKKMLLESIKLYLYGSLCL